MTSMDLGTPWHPFAGVSLRLAPVPRTATLWLVALLGAVSVGCPRGGGPAGVHTTPALTTDDADAEADLRAADRAADEGRARDAETLYRAFLVTHPDDATAPLAALGLGRLLLASGDVEGALESLARAAACADEVVVERAGLYRCVALHLGGRHAEAIAALSPLVGRQVDAAEERLLLRTLSAAFLAVGDPVAALGALDSVVALVERARGSSGTGTPTDTEAASAEADAAEARARITALADHELSVEQLAVAFDRLDRDGAAWARVALRALRAAHEAGDVARVRAIAEALHARHVELGDELASLVLRADRIATADPRAIGAILPLSGRGRDVGQRALRGLMLAAGTPTAGAPAADAPQLVFRDDGGDPARAVAAVEELISTHRVIAIVGPLDGPSAVAAARRAQQLGVPLIALSPSADLESVGPLAFQLFPTAEGEVRQLVRAARARGARRFAALHPQNGYGETLRALLERVAREEGAEVAAAVGYPPGTTNLGPMVARLSAGGADAVLLPDSARALALVAPALAAAGLWSTLPVGGGPVRGRAVTFLVPSVGFDAGLARSAGRYLQGALFSVPFHAPTSEGAGRAFTDGYLARFAAEPDVFSAYAYDAFRLVRQSVVSGATSRDEVARWLTADHEAATAGASAGLSTARRARAATRLLELRDGVFVGWTHGTTPRTGE